MKGRRTIIRTQKTGVQKIDLSEKPDGNTTAFGNIGIFPPN